MIAEPMWAPLACQLFSIDSDFKDSQHAYGPLQELVIYMIFVHIIGVISWMNEPEINLAMAICWVERHSGVLSTYDIKYELSNNIDLLACVS